MKNSISKNLSILLAILLAGSASYYFLLYDNFLHTSISSILSSSSDLDVKQHLVVVGLIPIYVSAMVFGVAMLGGMLINTIKEHFSNIPNQRPKLRD